MTNIVYDARLQFREYIYFKTGAICVMSVIIGSVGRKQMSRLGTDAVFENTYESLGTHPMLVHPLSEFNFDHNQRL